MDANHHKFGVAWFCLHRLQVVACFPCGQANGSRFLLGGSRRLSSCAETLNQLLEPPRGGGRGQRTSVIKLCGHRDPHLLTSIAAALPGTAAATTREQLLLPFAGTCQQPPAAKMTLEQQLLTGFLLHLIQDNMH